MKLRISDEQILGMIKEYEAGVKTQSARLIVSDNGTEMTSHAVLRWCQDTGVGWHYIAPHSHASKHALPCNGQANAECVRGGIQRQAPKLGRKIDRVTILPNGGIEVGMTEKAETGNPAEFVDLTE